MKGEMNKHGRDNWVFMSLQEQYWWEIKRGKKPYEFRKRYCKGPTTAFVYISGKARAVEGVVSFGDPIFGSSQEISALAEKSRPGSYQDIMSDLKGGCGYALPVLGFLEIEPVPLCELRRRFEGFSVPQSYYFLEKKPELLKFLLSKKIKITTDLGENRPLKRK